MVGDGVLEGVAPILDDAGLSPSQVMVDVEEGEGPVPKDFGRWRVSSDGSACTNPATRRQLTAWAEESDLWTHGYWGWDWADTYAKVGKVTPSNATIQLSGSNLHEATLRTPGLSAAKEQAVRARVGSGYPIKPKARVMIVNALSELDSPGE